MQNFFVSIVHVVRGAQWPHPGCAHSTAWQRRPCGSCRSTDSRARLAAPCSPGHAAAHTWRRHLYPLQATTCLHARGRKSHAPCPSLTTRVQAACMQRNHTRQKDITVTLRSALQRALGLHRNRTEPSPSFTAPHRAHAPRMLLELLHLRKRRRLHLQHHVAAERLLRARHPRARVRVCLILARQGAAH